MATGVKNAELLKQVHFSGEAKCDGFKPHWLRPSFCVECNKLFDKHSPELIPDDDCLLKAIAYSQNAEKVPSTIEAPASSAGGGGTGGLFLGGYRGVMNEQFLQESNIKFIVNTAKGLEIFGPKYLEAVKKAKEDLGIKVLELNWEDHEEFPIPDKDLLTSCLFIHNAISSGQSVLVHCAQGKSRSSTAVIAYLMAAKGLNSTEALNYVQSKRTMAQPNPRFIHKLKEFETSPVLDEIRHKILEK